MKYQNSIHEALSGRIYKHMLLSDHNDFKIITERLLRLTKALENIRDFNSDDYPIHQIAIRALEE